MAYCMALTTLSVLPPDDVSAHIQHYRSCIALTTWTEADRESLDQQAPFCSNAKVSNSPSDRCCCNNTRFLLSSSCKIPSQQGFLRGPTMFYRVFGNSFGVSTIIRSVLVDEGPAWWVCRESGRFLVSIYSGTRISSDSAQQAQRNVDYGLCHYFLQFSLQTINLSK